MKHLGDITKINGSAAPPVNVIIGGSPCQDLSVAGKRAGLAGERSGLFMEQIRIIKEMRKASERSGANDIKPRYMVWENVPGAFSSNKGQDFRAVLEEIVGIVKESKPDIPIPDGGWHYAGAVVGDGWSIAWRVFDAQFWGVPQRRRRIALVADFGGFTAPEILFERKGVFGDSPPGGTSWKDFTAAVAKRFGKSDSKRNDFEKNVVIFNGETVTSKVNASNPKVGDPCHTLGATGAERCYCIQGNAIDRADTAGCNGKGWREDKSYTLNTIDRPAVVGAICARDYKGISNQCVQQGKVIVGVSETTVRRLTPLECERLQGFPDGWTNIGDYIDSKGKKRKTSDSARYKALGNSIALPPWAWLLERLSFYCGDDRTMVSLFDGIGGFPLIWETLNGEGTCLWASEIEEFPIAVTKYHFNH